MNQGIPPSRRNQGRSCAPASWPTDVINGEDTLPPPEGHNPQISFEDRKYYLPFETWLPKGPPYPRNPTLHSWFWRKGFKTQDPDVIVRAYKECMQRNSNLLLNLSPDTTGRLSDEAEDTMKEVARRIRNEPATLPNPARKE
jgi:hypothetical protein